MKQSCTIVFVAVEVCNRGTEKNEHNYHHYVMHIDYNY